MIDTVDLPYATALLDRLAPLLGDEERTLRAAAPALGDDVVHERALRVVLARMGEDVSRRTLVYLSWMLERGRRAAPPAVGAMGAMDVMGVMGAGPTPARGLPGDADTTVDAEAHALRVPRLMCDAAGARWVVTEVGPVDPTDVARGSVLVFAKAQERRRQAVYPPDWRSLSNEALDGLLPPG